MQWIREKTQDASDKIFNWKDTKFGKSSLRKSIHSGGNSGLTGGLPNRTSAISSTGSSGNLSKDKSDSYNYPPTRQKSAISTSAISSQDYFESRSYKVGECSSSKLL
mmetsp:Transcript_35261/g.57129  ORF Transcript_35261/g.57129 Transcript_35261/m.57129 type:complete len:107 (+) Transcript_35261:136-456(+)